MPQVANDLLNNTRGLDTMMDDQVVPERTVCVTLEKYIDRASHSLLSILQLTFQFLESMLESTSLTEEYQKFLLRNLMLHEQAKHRRQLQDINQQYHVQSLLDLHIVKLDELNPVKSCQLAFQALKHVQAVCVRVGGEALWNNT